jgi:ABC-type dipeptide/oligopeptide/nickel transport system permease component
MTGRALLARLGWAMITVLAIVVLNFLVVHLVPGDPLQAIIGDVPAPPDYIAQVRHDFGLDQSVAMQLWLYLVNLAHGNLGFSFVNRQPVLSLLFDRAQFTLLLMLPALVIASCLGVALALVAAPRAGGAADTAITIVTLFGYSVPVFWLAQILVVVFAIHLGWLPAEGMASLRAPRSGLGAWTDVLAHMVLPVFSITIYYFVVVARVARANVILSLQQDFVLTAHSKGLSRGRVLLRHVLPNALIPVVTVIGYNFGHALTGAILTESVFGWPGLGSLFITAVQNRDYPVLEGIFLFTAITVVAANLITDLLYAVIDPRMRTAGRTTARGRYA